MTGRAISRLFEQPDRRNTEQVEFAVQPISQQRSPTLEVSAEWQLYQSYFNERLFDNCLPDCVITFTKRPGTYGYFCADSFRDRKGKFAHEIAMNPGYFAQGDVESFATLVHEQCHLWRHLFGPRNRKGGYGAQGYHDKPWADKMELIGLMPSSTGKPGGNRTGFQMLDYPIEGGAFDLACRELLISGHTVNWRDGRQPMWFEDPFVNSDGGTAAASSASAKPTKVNTRTRFICPKCDLRAWSRRSAKLTCNDCNRLLVAR